MKKNIKKSKILVTGATGNVGLEVVKFLIEAKQSVVIGVRNIEKARGKFSDKNDMIDFVTLDFTRPDTYGDSLDEIKKIFLVRPPKISDVKEYIFPFIEKSREKGVEQIVFLSLLGAERNRFVPHYKIEQYIIKSGIDYTFLRASFFMQNLNTTHCQDIKENNEIFLPAGKGKTSFIDVRDIAEVGAIALAEQCHKNKDYSLTGKKSVDYYQLAEIFSRVLDREIKYTNPNILNFYSRLRKRGMDRAYILIMIALYTTAKLGFAKKTTKDLEILLGREPKSIEQYVSDYKDCWI